MQPSPRQRTQRFLILRVERERLLVVPDGRLVVPLVHVVLGHRVADPGRQMALLAHIVRLLQLDAFQDTGADLLRLA